MLARTLCLAAKHPLPLVGGKLYVRPGGCQHGLYYACRWLKCELPLDVHLMARLFSALMRLALASRPLPLAQSRCLRYASLILTTYACAPA